MKNHPSLISRFALVALATGGLCCASVALGQKTTDLSPDEVRRGSLVATGSKPSKAEKAKMDAEKAGQPAAAAAKPTTMTKMGAQDQAFLMDAAKSGMMGVEMGKMAAKQSKSADVKNIGNMMVADHTKANSELMGLAKAKGVKLPGAAKMAKMSDANFDNAYLTAMVSDHQKDIAAFEKEAKSGVDPDVKAWAKKMLPALKSHLKAAQAAQKKMPKAG